MRIKYFFAIALAVLLSSNTVCHAAKKTTGTGYYFWPILHGGGTLLASDTEAATSWPGYTFSGGITFSIFERQVNFLEYTGNLFFFTDALYSYRAYNGDTPSLNYRIEETTADFAVGVGFRNIYIGAYAQIPNHITVKVREWTIEDFNGLSRNPSFSFMCGFRIVGDHLGVDARLLMGQGPGQFLRNSFGEYWINQLSLGVMAGF